MEVNHASRQKITIASLDPKTICRTVRKEAATTRVGKAQLTHFGRIPKFIASVVFLLQLLICVLSRFPKKLRLKTFHLFNHMRGIFKKLQTTAVVTDLRSFSLPAKVRVRLALKTVSHSVYEVGKLNLIRQKQKESRLVGSSGYSDSGSC